jgi:hypothetical protein
MTLGRRGAVSRIISAVYHFVIKYTYPFTICLYCSKVKHSSLAKAHAGSADLKCSSNLGKKEHI